LLVLLLCSSLTFLTLEYSKHGKYRGRDVRDRPRAVGWSAGLAGDALTSIAPQPGLRERKKQRTRALIADAALRLFLERGFDAVTIAEIAQAAEVDAKTIYNYFPSKPDLVFQRLEAYEQALLDAVRNRKAGDSILAAFARFVLHSQGLLAAEDASGELRAINRMIVASPALLAHEQQVFARFTASLAALIAQETGARPDDVQPSVVAHALIGFHRSLVEYVRRATLAGTPNTKLVRDLHRQATSSLSALEHGLGGYGVKGS
jgi:AcrR family transcriptional regulator